MAKNDRAPGENGAETRELSVRDIHGLLKVRGHGACLVDVREEHEVGAGFISGSLSIPGSTMESEAAQRLPDKNRSLILYSSEGVRSRSIAKMLERMGYKDVSSMAGGFTAWLQAGYHVESHGQMTEEQVRRYSRQILLREIGKEGQLALLRARILLVGAGGLASRGCRRSPPSPGGAGSTRTRS